LSLLPIKATPKRDGGRLELILGYQLHLQRLKSGFLYDLLISD
jgi:hypothetical protein